MKTPLCSGFPSRGQTIFGRESTCSIHCSRSLASKTRTLPHWRSSWRFFPQLFFPVHLLGVTKTKVVARRSVSGMEPVLFLKSLLALRLYILVAAKLPARRALGNPRGSSFGFNDSVPSLSLGIVVSREINLLKANSRGIDQNAQQNRESTAGLDSPMPSPRSAGHGFAGREARKNLRDLKCRCFLIFPRCRKPASSEVFSAEEPNTCCMRSASPGERAALPVSILDRFGLSILRSSAAAFTGHAVRKNLLSDKNSGMLRFFIHGFIASNLGRNSKLRH